jgi:hypothetical protein
MRLATIASREGRFHDAAAEATAAIDTRVSWIESMSNRVQLTHARGLRAIAAASDGDEDLARRDAAAVRAEPDAPFDAHANASLAEAVLLARHDDRAKLAELLRRDRRLLLHGMPPRERALVRAMERMVETSPAGVYRRAARRDEAASEETPLSRWLAGIAPGLAAFALKTDHAAPYDERPAVPPPAAAPAPPARLPDATEAPSAARRHGQEWKTLALWLLLVVLFLTIWQVMQPVSDPAPTALRSGPDFAPASFLSILFVLILALIVGKTAAANRVNARLGRAVRANVLGDSKSARAGYAALAKGSGRAAGLGSFGLASMAEDEGRFANAVEHCDYGLAQVRRGGGDDFVMPILLASRAVALASMDRSADAGRQLAELERDHPHYHMLACTQATVGLVRAVRSGDMNGARAIALARNPDLPLDIRHELLADALVAIEAGTAAELARIDRELEEEPELRSWLKAIAPSIEDDVRRLAREAREPT